MDKSKATVLVTGSSGLIGSAVCNYFSSDFNVIGFDRAGPPEPPPTAECICADLTSEKSIRAAFKRVRFGYGSDIAAVIHLAAYYDFSGKPSRKYEQITVRGTERLLHALKSFQVEQFIFSSTMLVHAPTVPGKVINEDSPIQPTWDYPKSKVKTEQLVLKQRAATRVALLRIAGVYDDLCHSIPLAHQIQRIYERKMTSRFYPGDLSRGQAFIHLDDLVDAISRTVHRRTELPEVFVALLGEHKTMAYGDLQTRLTSLIHGKSLPTKYISKPLAKTGARLQNLNPGRKPFIKPWMIERVDDHYELDISRARKFLDWKPRHSLRETLPKIVAALKSDPLRWYKENKLSPPRWLRQSENAPPHRKAA